MNLLKEILILVIGFVLLIKGADYFVEGSSSVARRLKVPSLIIGMTIVAMGTSLPECAVSVTASLAGNNTLAVSNVVGSNIFNLPLSILCAILLMFLGYFGMTLGHVEGVILLIIFVGYLLWMIQAARTARKNHIKERLMTEEVEFTEDDIDILPVWKCLIFIVGGMIAIKYGGDFVVDGASVIAAGLGLSQTLIGLTIVATGTSLPELVTSIVAARKNEVDMALGNVIGSNIFNILFVLGIAASISPVAFLLENIIDIIILVIMSLIVMAFAWTSQTIKRNEGIIMLVLYAVYLVYICIR